MAEPLSWSPAYFDLILLDNQSCHSAMNRLVSRVPPLFRLEENARYFPLFENTGNAEKASSAVTCSSPVPSTFVIESRSAFITDGAI